MSTSQSNSQQIKFPKLGSKSFLNFILLFAAIIFLSSCTSNQNDINAVPAGNELDFKLTVPTSIQNRNIEISEYNLTLVVSGIEVDMARQGNQWVGNAIVPMGSELIVSLTWSARGVDLATHNNNYGTATSSNNIAITPSNYTIIDSDQDGLSNLDELMGETNPFDDNSPGTMSPTVIRYTLPSFSVDENAGAVLIRVERLGNSSSEIEIEISTDTEGIISATRDVDFIRTSQILRWTAGEVGEKSIEVQIVNDNVVETDETFQTRMLNLTNPDDASVFRDGVITTVTIVDDDVDAPGPGPVTSVCGFENGSDSESVNDSWSDNCVIRRSSIGGEFADSLYSVGIQRVLFCSGFGSGNDYSSFADGEYGPTSESALRLFQASEGLVDDGVVGPQTWGRLQEQIELLEFGTFESPRDAWGFLDGPCAGITLFYQNFTFTDTDVFVELGGWLLARNQPNTNQSVPFSIDSPFDRL